MKLINYGILLLTLVLTACADRDPLEKIVSGSSGEMFNLVTSRKGRAAAKTLNGVEYYATFNDEEKTATVTISNLRLSEDDEPRSFTFSGLEWKFGSSNHTKQRVIQYDCLTPDDDFGTGYVFNDFLLIYMQANEFDAHNSAGFFVKYNVNGAYSVLAYPNEMLCQGSTMVRRVDGVTTSNVSYDTQYVVNLYPDESGSAEVRIHGLEVGAQTLDMTLSNLTLELTDNGYELLMPANGGLSLTADTEDLSVTDFLAQADLLTRLVITFDLNDALHTYAVTATLTPNLSGK